MRIIVRRMRTRDTPYYMFFGRESILPIDMLLKRKVGRVLRLSKIWRKANERQSEMDKRRRNYVIERNELKVGQKVYVTHQC